MLNGRLKILAVLLLSAMALFYFCRDLRLSDTEAPVKLPDIMVENLNFRRTMDGRDWHITALRADHTAGVVKALSIDLAMNSEQKKQRAKLQAQSAEFSDVMEKIELKIVTGIIFTAERSVDVKSGYAAYSRSDDNWQFREGLELMDKDLYLKGREAEFSGNRIFSLKKGAYARWKIK